jgi:hypothetical protein
MNRREVACGTKNSIQPPSVGVARIFKVSTRGPARTTACACNRRIVLKRRKRGIQRIKKESDNV